MMNLPSLLFIAGRMLLGGYFITSGYNHFHHLSMLTGYAQSKGVSMPKESVMVTGLMMLLGGLGVLLGVWVNVAVVLLAIFLVVTTLKMHQYWKVQDPMQKMIEMVNFEKNLGLLGAVLMLLAIHQPWRFAVWYYFYSDFALSLFLCP